MRTALAVALLLAGCGAPARAPETLDQMLWRTEGTTCQWLTAHDDASPEPDCRKLYDALVRGRVRVARWDPRAADLRLSSVLLYRPKTYWVDDKPYPLISLSGEGPGVTKLYARGSTSPDGPAFIQYAYEEVVEHEMTHALTRLLRGLEKRDAGITAADPGQDAYYGPPLEFLFQVQCHGTPDDLSGDGTAGKRDQCALPYSGPASGAAVSAAKAYR